MAQQELSSTNESSQPKSDLELALEEVSPQERLFCYEYLVDYKAPRAAEAVGRSRNAGKEILRKPAVARLINLLSEELAQNSLITRDMVQYEILHEYLPMAKGEKPVKGVDRDGIAWEGKVTNMPAYGKVLDMMSKHSGFTVPEVVSGGLTININHKAMGITIDGEVVQDGTESSE